MKYHCHSGRFLSRCIGDIEGHTNHIWLDLKGINDSIPLSRVKKYYRVAYDSEGIIINIVHR